MRTALLILVAAALMLSSCSKPMASAHMDDVRYFSRDYAAVPNDTYYAVRWALKENGLSVAEEDLPAGIIKTAWMPVTSDSHYIDVFGRRDYGVTNSYFRLDVRLTSRDGRTIVRVGSQAKTMADRFHSSGRVEYGVLNDVGHYLQKSAPEITNLGASE